jgi:regulator of protease activity HflC (stomatin/prohibitin superfamily)
VKIKKYYTKQVMTMNKLQQSLAYLTLTATLGGLTSCNRPTPQESTYRVDWGQEVTWQGKGPGLRWKSPFYSQSTVSHKQELCEFPYRWTENGKKVQLSETDAGIVTSASTDGIKEIMLQELVVSYAIKPTEKDVRKFMIEHNLKYREILQHNIDGLVRQYLQTKTKVDLESNQASIGTELLQYLKTYKSGGVPNVDATGKVIGFKDSYTLEHEWGIEFLDVAPRRIRPPSSVISAFSEQQEIIKRAEGEFESAKDDASRRLAKLDQLRGLSDALKGNPKAAEHLTTQLFAEMIENLGPENIGQLKLIYGLDESQKTDFSTIGNLGK